MKDRCAGRRESTHTRATHTGTRLFSHQPARRGRKPMKRRRRHSLIERLEPRQLLSASLVKDINTGPPLSNGFNGAVGAGNIVFLSQEDGVAGIELYKTDGTTDGTVLVKDIRPGRDNAQ